MIGKTLLFLACVATAAAQTTTATAPSNRNDPPKDGKYEIKRIPMDHKRYVQPPPPHVIAPVPGVDVPKGTKLRSNIHPPEPK